jgi:hypothetical protein
LGASVKVNLEWATALNARLDTYGWRLRMELHLTHSLSRFVKAIATRTLTAKEIWSVKSAWGLRWFQAVVVREGVAPTTAVIPYFKM